MGTPGCSTRLLFPFSRKPASCATIFRPTDRGPPLTAPSGIHALLVKGTFVSVPASESQQLCKKEERYQQIFFESEQNRSFLTCMWRRFRGFVPRADLLKTQIPKEV
ncbi:uncharacterized protein LOC144772707 isoform X3 [Lissotriton helveticus]